jgi:hypothetical protein
MSKFMLSMGLVLVSLTGLANAMPPHQAALMAPMAQLTTLDDDDPMPQPPGEVREYYTDEQEAIARVGELQGEGYNASYRQVDESLWLVEGYKF